MKINPEILSGFHLIENENLKNQSTIKIGGYAKNFLIPETETELIELINLLDAHKEKYIIFGRGSNIIFADTMKTEHVISTKSINKIQMELDIISVQAGQSLRELCYLCAREGYSGLEGLSGIPGTVGGGAYMNAGAYGYTFSDSIREIRAYDRKSRKIISLNNKECHFDYRKSIFMNTDQVILSVSLALKKQESEEIKKRMAAYEHKRAMSQPLDMPSAGSVFKKPFKDFYTARIIEELGLKGFCIGDACVSEKHAGFIVNKKMATSRDVKQLMAYIVEQVYEKTGERLSAEIEFFE